MQNKLFGLLIFFGLTGVSLAKETASPFVVNIDNPNFRKLVVATPTFFTVADAEPETKKLAEQGAAELTRLLTFSGLFNVMSPAGYQELVTAAQKDAKKSGLLGGEGIAGIDTEKWKALGVESLTIGEISKKPEGYVISLRTADAYKKQLILGKRYSKVSSKELNQAVRTYADHLLAAYTGKPGIFSTKLTFVGRRSKTSEKQIFIADFDGTNVKQITSEKAIHVSPSWSPDGRYVTYASYEDGNRAVFRYEVATGKKIKLTEGTMPSSGPSWSPNGKHIVYSGSMNGDSDIYTMTPDGKNSKRIIRGKGQDVEPAFSPDGKWLAFVSDRFKNPHIFRASLKWSGEGKVTVTGDQRMTYAGWQNSTPAWSPDSSQIAFGGYDKDIDRYDIFLMKFDGSELERLTIRSGNNERPSWAPNGQLIVFESNRGKGRDTKDRPQIYVMHKDGSNQRLLPTGLYETQTPQWGPTP